MNAPQLPAYLQNRQSQGVAARATAGMGGILPPHISIAGNGYTLIDAAGNKMPLGQSMQACVVDISDHMNKRYYENEWTQGSDEPPTCFSRNGVSPSRDSQSPQANFCSECEWNKRGSDTSKLSGKPIKACRDEKDLALLLAQFPTMLFQLTVPPGSFKNWSAFIAPFKPGGPDVSDVLVSFGFQPQANGVMTFQATAYIDEATFAARETAIAQKATDVLVGRNDVPIAITHQPSNEGKAVGSGVATTYPQPGQGFGGQPQAQAPFGTPSAQTATNPGTTSTTSQFASTAAGTATPERAPRKRRTQAEIAADNAAKAAAQGGAATPPGQTVPVQPQAPFPVNQPQAGFGGAPPANPFGAGPAATSTPQQTGAGFAGQAPTGNAGSFGIQNGADPNVDPALAEMLRGLGQ